MTLCRFRSPAPYPRPQVEPRIPAYTIGSVLLMRSVLLPGGAEHREVARIALEGPGGEVAAPAEPQPPNG